MNCPAELFETEVYPMTYVPTNFIAINNWVYMYSGTGQWMSYLLLNTQQQS